MTECCGTELTTPFCPTCGKAGDISSALGLRLHLEQRVKSIQRDVKETERRAEQYPEIDYTRHINRKNRLLAKWQSWETVLRKLMEQN